MDSTDRLRAARAAEEKARQARQRDASKERLLRIMKKKLKTTFIGDIARVEKYFGSLWGLGKASEDLSENERAWGEVWALCRTEMLNNGNAQSRALESEITLHEVQWQRVKTILRVEGKNERSKQENVHGQY